MKKYILLFSTVIFCFWLTACGSKNNPQKSTQFPKEISTKESKNSVDTKKTDEVSERLKQYKSFLQDEISSEDKSGDYFYLRDLCNTVVPEETEDGIQYALYDMTGDGLPELHILTDISYTVHTVKNNRLIIWYQGDRYNRPLNNGMIFRYQESTGIHYVYLILDSNGEEILYVCFSKPSEYDKSDVGYIFSTGDDYDYNRDVELSKEEWKKLTKKFLEMKSDKIIWENIDNLDF